MLDLSAFQVLFTFLTSWLNRRKRDVLMYLLEENRVLRRQLSGRRLRLTDDDRCRLAVRAVMSHDCIDRRRRQFAECQDADGAFVAINVALFLPFRCTKERQMAASAGTKRRPKIAGFFE